MIIKIGTTTSSNNTVNKQFTVVHECNCNLLDGSSVITPTITLTAVSLVNCNYCEIPAFNRFYYISNYEMVTTNLLRLHLKVDVLNSFKSQILENYAIINRQANDWNLYINDGSLKTYQNNITDQYKCSGSLSGDSLVLSVSGGNNEPIKPPQIDVPSGGGDGGEIMKDNLFYTNVAYNGYNPCIVRNKETGSVLPNCVGYAYGRFQEMANIKHPIDHLPACNATDWYARAKPYFKTGVTPAVGAVICFGGKYGHVGIVESIQGNQVKCSMSDYSGRMLYYMTFEHPRYHIRGLNFQGFIYNPYINNGVGTNTNDTNGNEQPRTDTNETNVHEQHELNELEILNNVLNGVYGVGEDRKKKLASAGLDYKQVQGLVNKYYSTANAVIRGVYGNGKERKDKLEVRGYDYKTVQKIVNSLLK